MRVRIAIVTAVAATALAFPTAARAQTDVTLELGASLVGPPAGTDAERARFGVAGLRASRYGATGSELAATLLVGRAFGGERGGDFLSASLGGELERRWASGWTAGLDVEAAAFTIAAPFPYRAVALEGGPALGYDFGAAALELSALLGLGRSRVEPWRAEGGGGPVLRDDLWRWGGVAELTVGDGALRAGLSGELHETPGGGYRSAGVRLVWAGGWGAVEARAGTWHTPLGSEVTGGLALLIPLSGWSVRGFAGRSAPDPLTLTEPGSGSFGLLVGRSVYSSEAEPAAADAYELLAPPAGGGSGSAGNARVRVRVRAPAGASRVELLGDFTLWQPVPMQRAGEEWRAEVSVPQGTHHYGFLVDGEWFVPPDLDDVVPDGWGRVSAILVIEGVEP